MKVAGSNTTDGPINPRSPARAQRPYRIMVWMLAVCLLGIHVIGIWWLDRWALGVSFDAYLGLERVVANAAVGLVAICLLAALSRRLLFPIVVVSGVTVLVYIASAIKLTQLGIPLVLQDAYFVTGLDLSSLRMLSKYIHSPMTLLASVVGGIGLLGGLYWLDTPWCRPRAGIRLIVLGSATALILSLYFAVWPWSHWYDSKHIRPSPLAMTPAVLHGGLIASMVYYHGVHRNQTFIVDEKALKVALDLVEHSPEAMASSLSETAPKPDVVIVLSESFMDPRMIKGLDQVADIIPGVRAQIAAGNGGYMLAPTYGGGTVRTEFEILTGMPVAAFPTVYSPYVDLTPGFLPGIFSVFEKHGYASFAIHGNSGAFWNRTNTYEAMGIDRFITQGAFVKNGARQDGNWWSDQDMTDMVLAELERAEKPTVALAISIENHGPYDSKTTVLDPAGREAIEIPTGTSAATATELRNYFYHLRHADQAFTHLLDSLKARQRPFVLLFFGDHLPALNDVYGELGLVDGREPKEQDVPWVMVTGGLPVPPRSVKDPIFAWQLSAMLLETAGIQGDPYFTFIGKLGPYLEPAGRPGSDPRLVSGLHAAANARLNDRFEDYVRH